MKVGRLEAFSDGVIAIAITLLVLEIHVTPTGGESLWRALGHEWPSFVGYAISFLTIGIVWINHHALLDLVGRADRGLMGWNLFLLGAIGLLPFTTGLMAEHLTDGSLGRSAVAVYALSMGVVGSGFLGLWWHLGRRPALLADAVTRDDVAARLRRTLPGPIVYLVAALVALLNAPAGLAVTAAPAVYFALAPRGSSSG